MSSPLKIVSLNVRGLRNQSKRRAIFTYLKNQKATLYCLQETFSQIEDEKVWTAEWGGQTLFSHGSEHSKGVCIFLKVNSAFVLNLIYADPNGRYIIAKLKIGDEELFVVNVYAPNHYLEQATFIRNLEANLMAKTDTTKLIISGDWNCTLTSKDKQGGATWRETDYRNAIINLMDEFNLADTYRKLHPNAKAFTYESKSLKLKSRIDFFLISNNLTANARRAEIRTSIAPDHKTIFLSLEIADDLKRGPGSSKFNNKLLEDESYVQLINESYPAILDKYKDLESKQLLWEMIKMEVRAKTISFSKRRRLEFKQKEIDLQNEIDELDRKICAGNCLDTALLNTYEEAKKQLKEIYDLKGKEAMFRSKARWVEQGEKPTKYFFNLEKKNYAKKTIKELKVNDSETLTDLKDINRKIEEHFTEMLSSKIRSEETENEHDFDLFIKNLEIPKLSNEEQNLLEHDVSAEEIKNALKRFQKNKTPGDDGFSVEFYETFIDLIGGNLLDSYNEAYQNNKLSISQRRGIISLIPKSDENLNDITNWRPITLLNVDYKVLARIIAMRVEPFLPNLIHPDQTGFIKGRYIGQNVRLLNDLMTYTESNKIAGTLLFIDFEKAYDTLEWRFIHRTLKTFNFGPKIRNWISVLYNDIESGVMNAGFMTNYFKISRGVRQGCPLSPFLFILAVEILAIKLRQDPKCKGITLPNFQEVKLSQFADDTTIISDSVDSLKTSLQLISMFGEISGLKLNKKKTKAMWIGSSKDNKGKILNFQCVKEPTKILGTYISHNESKNNEQNFFRKIEKMKTNLNIWQGRDLSLYGRTLLAKTLGVSQLIYVASMLNVPECVIQKTQSELFSFLWRNKNDKIKRDVIYQPLSAGGLNFVNFRTMVKSLRLSWIGRIIGDADCNANWKAIPNYYFDKYGGLALLLQCNYNVKSLDLNLPTFYRELLQYFNELVNMHGGNQERKFILWNNKEITIEGKTLFWKTWFEKGIYLVQDLLDQDGKFLSLQDFQSKFGLRVNYLHYFQIIAAISSELRGKAFQTQTQTASEDLLKNLNNFQLSQELNIMLSKMRCKDYYKLFNDFNVTEPTGVKNWRQQFPNSFAHWKNNFAKIYRITKENKLRQFLFKLLHKVIVTKKELKKFKITSDDRCSLCSNQDSITHTFAECPETKSIYTTILSWFNNINNLNVTPSVEQILFHLTEAESRLTDAQERRLDLLFLCAKQYIYACKTFLKTPNVNELKRKIETQWEIENCFLVK